MSRAAGVPAQCRTRPWALALAAALAGLIAGPALACRQALAMGIDVSGSVDAREYRLQLDGLARALTDPQVREALLAPGSPPVRIAVYEWSGVDAARLILPWTTLTGEAELQQAAARLADTRRMAAEESTALGAALLYGAELLAGQSDCTLLTLDLSGDGTNNIGPPPEDVPQGALPAGLTVNALAIGTGPRESFGSADDVGALVSYFRTRVIRGPRGFVEAALGYTDYQTAMRRKLLREVQVMAIGAVTGPGASPDARAPG